MSIELEQNLSQIKDKVLKVSNESKRIKEEYKLLEEKYNLLKEKYEEEQKKNEELLEEQKKLKMLSAISGNPEHNRLMKNHINRLIKEIDACILHLKNTGL